MRASLNVALAQPECVPGDTRAYGLFHARAVVDAGARVVVFPELSLTGYELDAALVEPGDTALDPVVAACASTGSTALVGAPIPGPGDLAYIAMLELAEQERRAVSIAGRCRAYVALASLPGLPAAGTTTWPDRRRSGRPPETCSRRPG